MPFYGRLTLGVKVEDVNRLNLSEDFTSAILSAHFSSVGKAAGRELERMGYPASSRRGRSARGNLEAPNSFGQPIARVGQAFGSGGPRAAQLGLRTGF